MRLINGLLKPTSGEVLIDGVPTSQLKTSELASKVGFLFQNPDRQICCKTVREELLFGFAAQGRAGAEAEAKVDAMIERFGFDGDAEPFLLNRGTRQLLALASIIVLEPPIVVLDEPTTGLDFRECAKVMEVVSDLNARGTTVVMVCHDMEVVGDYAKRVIAMTAGQVVADGATFDVLRDAGVLSVRIFCRRRLLSCRCGLRRKARFRPYLLSHVRTRSTTWSARLRVKSVCAGKGTPNEGIPRIRAGRELFTHHESDSEARGSVFAGHCLFYNK